MSGRLKDIVLFVSVLRFQHIIIIIIIIIIITISFMHGIYTYIP